LRHTEEKLKDRSDINKDLTVRAKLSTDELRKESDRIKADNEKKREVIGQYNGDNKSLEERIALLQSEIKSFEVELAALRKKHDYTVNDLTNATRRLEQDNYTLQKAKEDLERR